MTELERICLKQNATELRRVANNMSALQDANRLGLPEEIDDLKDRLNDVVRNMKNLQTILSQPLTYHRCILITKSK